MYDSRVAYFAFALLSHGLLAIVLIAAFAGEPTVIGWLLLVTMLLVCICMAVWSYRGVCTEHGNAARTAMRVHAAVALLYAGAPWLVGNRQVDDLAAFGITFTITAALSAGCAAGFRRKHGRDEGSGHRRGR